MGFFVLGFLSLRYMNASLLFSITKGMSHAIRDNGALRSIDGTATLSIAEQHQQQH